MDRDYKDLPIYCRDHPEEFQLCNPWMCVKVNETCPCTIEDFICSRSECVPMRSVCNGVIDCSNGLDEISCQTKGSEIIIAGVPLSVFIGALVTSVVIGLTMSVCLFYCARRYYRQNSQANVSSKEPLQTTPECVCEVIQLEKGGKNNTKTKSLAHKEGLSRHNLGYELVSQDTLCNFGDELLCTSTPRQGVRGLRHSEPSPVPVMDLRDFRQSPPHPAHAYKTLFPGVYEKNNNQGYMYLCQSENARAIGDGAGTLNLDLFESIT